MKSLSKTGVFCTTNDQIVFQFMYSIIKLGKDQTRPRHWRMMSVGQ